MSPILLIHGWGLNARLWDPVRERLGEAAESALDFGFYGKPRFRAASRPLVVGHSLGFAWALANIPRPWAGAMAINGFARFTHAPDFPEGVPQRVVGRMLARFATAPEEVVSDFLDRCGMTGPIETLGLVHEPLRASLSWLALCDERPTLTELDCPVSALAGDVDPIVSAAMSRVAFAGHALDLVEGGGHLLPLTHADRVAASIAAFHESCR